jgi:hypothetical protein
MTKSQPWGLASSFSGGLENQSMSDLERDTRADNARSKGRSRAAIYVARLAALRFETLILRCQITNGRSTTPRPLLATRLDATDARTADIHARLIEARAT